MTGQYLTNAQVSVKGTAHVASTDEFGVYRLVNLPPGPAVLEVFYTDLDREQIAVEIAPGKTIECNVALTSRARYGQDPGVVKLNPYVVSSEKETDGQALALNEQRFASNIKNVVSTDAFGDILGSNVGEFLKFIPGITATYSAAGDIDSINVRGFGGEKVAIDSPSSILPR